MGVDCTSFTITTRIIVLQGLVHTQCAHPRCTPKVHTQGAHTRCTHKVYTKGAHPRPGAHQRCTPMVHTQGAHPRCTPKVHIQGAHPRCTPKVHTQGAHPRCTPKVHTQGAHTRCTHKVYTKGAHPRPGAYQRCTPMVHTQDWTHPGRSQFWLLIEFLSILHHSNGVAGACRSAVGSHHLNTAHPPSSFLLLPFLLLPLPPAISQTHLSSCLHFTEMSGIYSFRHICNED